MYTHVYQSYVLKLLLQIKFILTTNEKDILIGFVHNNNIKLYVKGD